MACRDGLRKSKDLALCGVVADGMQAAGGSVQGRKAVGVVRKDKKEADQAFVDGRRHWARAVGVHLYPEETMG